MRLMTKQVEKALQKAPLYSTDGKEEKKIICKYFFGAWTWYVIEGEFRNGDWLFFGIVDVNGEREYGYFTLSQLKSVKWRGYSCVERDLYFKPVTIKSIEDVKGL